jgi:hypothetical protein
MDIKIFHCEGEEYLFDDSVIVYHFREDKDDATNFMLNILQNDNNKLKPVIIITNIFCDYVEGPCGCFGYNVCDWHTRRYCCNNSDFAPCLCSKNYNITCEYHLNLL